VAKVFPVESLIMHVCFIKVKLYPLSVRKPTDSKFFKIPTLPIPATSWPCPPMEVILVPCLAEREENKVESPEM
jgi:hypothetical protein